MPFKFIICLGFCLFFFLPCARPLSRSCFTPSVQFPYRANEWARASGAWCWWHFVLCCVSVTVTFDNGCPNNCCHYFTVMQGIVNPHTGQKDTENACAFYSILISVWWLRTQSLRKWKNDSVKLFGIIYIIFMLQYERTIYRCTIRCAFALISGFL